MKNSNEIDFSAVRLGSADSLHSNIFTPALILSAPIAIPQVNSIIRLHLIAETGGTNLTGPIAGEKPDNFRKSDHQFKAPLPDSTRIRLQSGATNFSAGRGIACQILDKRAWNLTSKIRVQKARWRCQLNGWGVVSGEVPEQPFYKMVMNHPTANL